jgi:hypothetical protein
MNKLGKIVVEKISPEYPDIITHNTLLLLQHLSSSELAPLANALESILYDHLVRIIRTDLRL